MKGVPRIGHPDVYGAGVGDPEDLHVVMKKPGSSGPPRPARARVKVRRTPKDVSKARSIIQKAIEDLQAGRISATKAQVLIRAGQTLLKFALKRVAAREAERPKVQPVVEFAPWVIDPTHPVG